MSELVTCKDLTKRFGNHTALDHLNLSPGFRENYRTAGAQRKRKDDALKAAERTADPE